MIKQVSKIDSDGFFVEPVIVNDEDFDEDNPLHFSDTTGGGIE
ncbi:hypothetical protein [Geobacillus sp. FJAT-46040]|nr:hypothetical protein [Geobacillus sp. FJAT-46040]